MNTFIVSGKIESAHEEEYTVREDGEVRMAKVVVMADMFSRVPVVLNCTLQGFEYLKGKVITVQGYIGQITSYDRDGNHVYHDANIALRYELDTTSPADADRHWHLGYPSEKEMDEMAQDALLNDPTMGDY